MLDLLFSRFISVVLLLTLRLLVDKTSHPSKLVKLMHFIVWLFLEAFAKALIENQALFYQILSQPLLVGKSLAHLIHDSHGMVIRNTY